MNAYEKALAKIENAQKQCLNKSNDLNLKYDCMHVIKGNFTKDVILTLTNLPNILNNAFLSKSLNDITEYIYKLTTIYNRFYTENIILKEKDELVRSSWLYLTEIVYKVNNILLNILAIKVPDKM